MFKVYLSRRQTRAMSIDHPIGDPTGGPAYREFRDPTTAIAASAGANVLGSVIGGSASKSAAGKQSKAALQAAEAQMRTASQQIDQMQQMRSQQILELQQAQADAIQRGQNDRAAALQQVLDQRTDALARIYGEKDILRNVINVQRDDALKTIGSQRDQSMQTFQPYMQTGQQGLTAIQEQLPYFQQQFGPEQFKANLDPGYEFMKQQGLGAIRQGMNVGGGGSNIDRAATKFAQDYANTGYQNAFNRFTGQQQNIYNRLAGIAGIGQTATGQAAQTGLGYGQLGAQTGLGYGQLGAQSSLAYDSLGAQTGLGYGQLGGQLGLGYDQLISADQRGYNQINAQFNQGMGANIANLATGGAASQAAGITGSAQASASGDVGMANAFQSGLGNAGNLGMQYALFNTPAIQQSLGLGGAQTGGASISGLGSSLGSGSQSMLSFG
jgi:hypothetical protein